MHGSDLVTEKTAAAFRGFDQVSSPRARVLSLTICRAHRKQQLAPHRLFFLPEDKGLL